jgi:hypothetical protein
MREGGVIAISVGAAWTRVVIKDDDYWLPDWFGSMSIGLTYWDQEQFQIGSGKFLGVEATFTGGTNVETLLQGVLAGADDD